MALTRRLALAAPAALAASPALAGLAPADTSRAPARPDPAVAAFHRWRAAFLAIEADDSPEVPKHLCTAEGEALDALAETKPETAEGLALLARGALFSAAGSHLNRGVSLDPLAWRLDAFDLEHADRNEAATIRLLLGIAEAAERLAAQAG